jgi:hypothetical protein
VLQVGLAWVRADGRAAWVVISRGGESRWSAVLLCLGASTSSSCAIRDPLEIAALCFEAGAGESLPLFLFLSFWLSASLRALRPKLIFSCMQQKPVVNFDLEFM